MATLREVREKAGMTQAEAAKRLGVSRPTYAAYEANVGAVKIWRAEQIAEVFGITLKDIVDMTRTEEDEIIDGIVEDLRLVLLEHGLDERRADDLASQMRTLLARSHQAPKEKEWEHE